MALGSGKRTWSSIFYSRLKLVALLFVSFILVFSVYERYVIEREMAERRREAETELTELKKRKAELEAKVEYLGNEEGIEAEIRTHFDVAREGEQVVIIVDDTESETGIAASVQPARVSDAEGGFWASFFPW